MSHMKVEPANEQENPSNESLHELISIEKQEVAFDDDINEDQMTEAPGSPRILDFPEDLLVPLESGPPEETHIDEPIRNDSDYQTTAATSSRKEPAPIKKRRLTSTKADESHPKPDKKKRRFCHADEMDVAPSVRMGGKIDSSKNKRVEEMSNGKATQTGNRITNHDKSDNGQESIRTSMLPNGVEATPPQKKRHRIKNLNVLSTPPITQFFSQKSALRCDKCCENLSSRNELRFHIKSHERKQCVKCHKRIDNQDPSSIRRHVISCLLLNNQLPKEQLTHFLKVKVDLNRLTPIKIARIQRDLYKKSQSSDANRPKETENASEPATEMVQTSNDESIDSGGRDSTTKKRNRKPSIKPAKVATNRINDSSFVKENISAKINWNEDVSKDKLFTLRSFENDSKTYVDIKRVDNGNTLEEIRLNNFVTRIKLLKQQAAGKTPNPPSKPMNDEPKQPAAKPAIEQNLPNTSAPVLAQAKPPTSVKTPQPPPLRELPLPNVPIPTKEPHAPLTPTAPPRNSENVVNGMPIGANISFVPATPIASIAPAVVIVSGANGVNTAIPVHITTQSNVTNVPQLLGLPNRLRNRAMSMHYSAGELNPLQVSSMRRQSVSERPSENNFNNNSYIRTLPWLSLSSAQQQEIPGVPQGCPPPYMTKVHNASLALNVPGLAPRAELPPKTAPPTSQSTLKVLSVDDLNSRAVSAAQSIQSNAMTNRTDSPNSAENNSNLNNNQATAAAAGTSAAPFKRVRTKNTPLRAQMKPDDEDNFTILVSLSRLSSNTAELTLTTQQYGKINYDSLSDKRKQEVENSLLKDDVWMVMMNHLKTIRPTPQTMALFRKILQPPQRDIFLGELQKVWGQGI